MTKKELLARVAALGSVSDEQRNGIICTLIGHSGIVTTCFGYIYCGRCDAQIGDSLGGSGTTERNTIIGHNCETCRTNYASMTWKDKLFVRDPFKCEAA